MRDWLDVTAQFASVYYRPAFGEAGEGLPGSTVAAVNPAGPWPLGGSYEYAVYRLATGDRHYALSDGAWVPSNSDPPLYIYNSAPDPAFRAPGVLGLALPAPVVAYGARVTYQLAIEDESGAPNVICSILPSTAEGTLSSLPAEPMTPGESDDPWSTTDGLAGWYVSAPYVNNVIDEQLTERPASEFARPVQVIIAAISGFTGPRETFDQQFAYLKILKVELYVELESDFWTDFINAVER